MRHWSSCASASGPAARSKYHAANAAKGKLFARERVALLVDEGSFVEDGLLANALADGLPADGVVTGTATIDGRPVCLMANDSTVKAGSLGRPHRREDHPDHRAGLRAPACRWSTWSTRPAPGSPTRSTCSPAGAAPARSSGTRSAPPARSRRSARCSARRAAGGAYIPAFCDVVAMVDGNASMYLGSDRMVEMVTGEKTTLEAMGGARVHCAESGVGHFLVQDRGTRRSTWSGATCPTCRRTGTQPPPAAPAVAAPANVDLAALVPASERQAFDMRRYVKGLLDEGSFFEIHALWARELTVGFGRLDGEVVGVVGNNSMFKGGVLFVDSADKATRFVQLCDAFNVPLLFLADVPGFMVGTRGGEAGHHPARRQDDHRDLRGDRAEDLRGGAQGVRRRPLRDGRPRASSRTPPSRCPPRRSP